ncbi:MAG: type VI secretion system membrane subunit TssM [Gammaproteobacteria bacterium]|nr:MAG: type VI secretion system membrane subunit TssM [Gammaproteobacteria bacterium]
MNRVVSFLTDRRFLSILGLIALAILIWFGGPYVHFGENNVAPLGSVVARLVAIIILLAIWGLNNFRVQYQNRQRTTRLLQEVQGLEDDAPVESTDHSQEELQTLQKRFADAMSILRRTHFQQGRNKDAKALYQLPWYIIIGPPGSGKTTALVNSGLQFPLADQMGMGSVQGVGGTRNCDWWFTNEAVLLDTAGRYTTQDSHKVADSKAWTGFLDLLLKHRKRRPINGAIIAISIQDLLTQTADERTYHARTIRARIDELVEKLGINFPIYVMFTKCDLLAGFSEFFDELTLEQREQVWGMTFPLPDDAHKGYAFDEQLFEQKYADLLNRLHMRVLDQVQREHDPKTRSSAVNFPNQFESIKGAMSNFLKQTFAPNRFQEQPFLRGIYFSSGTQQGTPIDRMMSSVASGFGLPPSAVQTPPGQGKSFFIHRLFKNIVFPEAELVGANRQYELMLKWARWGAYAAFAVIFIVSVVVWVAAYSRNQAYLDQVAQHYQRYQELVTLIQQHQGDLRNILPALQELRRASEVFDQESLPWLAGLGLHDARVENEAKAAYQRELSRLLLPRITNRVASALQKSSYKDPNLHNTLLVYLMFGDPAKINNSAVKDWMLADWENLYRGQTEVQATLQQHLDALLAAGFEPVKLNQRALAKSRSELKRVPVAKRIYNRIKNEPQYRAKVDLRGLLGDSTSTVFANKHNRHLFSMPFFFTKQGYQSVDLSEDSDTIRSMFADRWIMGEEDESVYNDNEIGKISQQIKNLYLAEYTDRWRQFLNGMKVNNFGNLEQSRRILALLADPVYSPLLAVLKVTAENTRLTPQLPAAAASKTGALSRFLGGDEASKGAGLFKGNRVDKHFRELNLLSRETDGSSRIARSLSNMRNVQDYVNNIILAPDSTEAAFNAAKARLLASGDDVIKALRIEASSLPDPVRRWYLSVADQTWRAVLGNAKAYLNAQWKNQVYRTFVSDLQGRFPVYKNAVDELAIFDFAEYFKPEGVHDTFMQTYVTPFVDIESWRIKTLNGRGLYLSPEAIDSMKKAEQIKDMLFKVNPSSPGFHFKMKPYRMDASVRRFQLSYGGQRMLYTHGPKISQEVSWPGDGSTSVRMSFEDLNDSIKRVNYDGPWAFFRLLQDSPVSATRRSNVYRITFSTLGRKSVWEVTAKSSNNPFKTNAIAQYRCPETL